MQHDHMHRERPQYSGMAYNVISAILEVTLLVTISRDDGGITYPEVFSHLVLLHRGTDSYLLLKLEACGNFAISMCI